jgi:hypothetical protein
VSYDIISYIGSFVFSVSTATFAIKTGYFDKVVDKSRDRYNSLSHLYDILSGLERFRQETIMEFVGVTHMGGARQIPKTVTRRDDELLNRVDDAAFMILVDGVPEKDKAELGISHQNIGSLKILLYNKKDTLLNLIKRAEGNYQKEKRKRINNLKISYVIYLIVFGVALMMISRLQDLFLVIYFLH